MPWPKTGATHYQAQLGLLRQRSCKRKEGAGVKKLRVHRMPRPKTGATHCQAQLGLLRQRPCKRKDGAGVKKLYVKGLGTLFRLSIGSFNISQQRRIY